MTLKKGKKLTLSAFGDLETNPPSERVADEGEEVGEGEQEGGLAQVREWPSLCPPDPGPNSRRADGRFEENM